jgi:hypothetical protein
MEHGGVEIMHADGVLFGSVAEFVGASVADPRLDAATGKHVGKAFDVMIASTTTLRHRCAPKFPAPND